MKTRHILRFLIFILLISGIYNSTYGQTAKVTGRVTDSKNRPLEFANIAISGTTSGTSTLSDGSFSLTVPAKKRITLAVSVLGYISDSATMILAAGEEKRINFLLNEASLQLKSVTVEDKQLRSTNLTRVNPRIASVMTSASGGIESLLKTLPGVVSNNELSSQYSVRGGSYDENLVYVNDIEIYRPFLTKSGQQEGLSFLNSDLVSSVLFSAGGFQASYGDKLSSALDIRYKQPQSQAGSVSLSLLGTNLHIEGTDRKGNFTYLTGIRYKTNKYLLNSLETKGDYNPVSFDIQSLLCYRISPKLDFSFLGYVARNRYELVPESRRTQFGTLFEPLRLTIYFDGKEADRYNALMGAGTFNWKIHNNFQSKIIVSGYRSAEVEAYDIIAQYWIALLDNRPDVNDSIEVIETKGVGGYITHARNKLTIDVYNFENKYSYVKGSNFVQWGYKLQHEKIDDKLREWMMIDSSGFSLPYNPGTPGAAGNLTDLNIRYFMASDVQLTSNRITAFAQNTFELADDLSKLTLTTGLRMNYWDLNHELIISPRASLSFKPNWEKDIILRFATGYYSQPPFYRELRNFKGEVNRSLKSQKSLHIVVGSDWNFTAWTRPFKFVAEAYYKHLWDLVPFEVDNVRIRYTGKNESKGYATGIDLKVNGEFVKGVESWASLSIMQTEEDIKDDFYYDYYNAKGELIRYNTTDQVRVDSTIRYPGYFPRPTDQRVTFSLFFQDYLPRNPSYKMNVGLFFGSGLTTGAPSTPLFTHVRRMPPYRRVDIGMSKEIIGETVHKPAGAFFKQFKSLWVTLEILNLLQVNNTISYNWVRDIEGNQYAVPNYLTPRQVNIRLTASF